MEYVCHYFTLGRISNTCLISMWRNETKCKHMFMFPLKNLAHKGLLLICIWMRWMVHSHEVSWPPYETYTSSLWPGYISELGQHWFRWWLTPAQCQAITWTSADPVNWFMDLMDHKYIELKFIIYFPDKTCVYVYDVWYCFGVDVHNYHPGMMWYVFNEGILRV